MPFRNPYHPVGTDDDSINRSMANAPTYPIRAAWGFVRCWVSTREIRYLVKGLPALTLAALLAALFLSGDRPVSRETIDRYLSRAKLATQSESFDEADFYFRKLERMAPNDRKVVHEHALLYARQGNYGEAFRRMESLAQDDDHSNDNEVRLWLAKTALNEDVGLEQPLEYAKRQLVAVLEDDPKELNAHNFFAWLYIRQGDLPSAVQHLERVAPYSAELQLMLASLYLRLDPPDRRRAEINAANALTALARKVEELQTGDVNTYHQLAAAQVILRKYEDALRTLHQAGTRFNSEATQRQIARTYVAWSDDVIQESPDAIAQRLKLLEKALEAAPNEPQALHRMLDIASTEGPSADEAEQRLRQALVDGVAPAAIHFSLGCLAAKRGDTEAAMRHFQQSSQLNPRTAVTLNNIAYLMSQAQSADMLQALELINQALTMAPQAPQFRDTRGQILVRLGRWTEAISDLEYANSRMDEPPARLSIYRSLIVAYENLGDAPTADVYRQKYDVLLAQVGKVQTSSDIDVPDVVLEQPLGETTDSNQPVEDQRQ